MVQELCQFNDAAIKTRWLVSTTCVWVYSIAKTCGNVSHVYMQVTQCTSEMNKYANNRIDTILTDAVHNSLLHLKNFLWNYAQHTVQHVVSLGHPSGKCI